MPSTHTCLHVHVVFSTRDREPWLAQEWRPRTHAMLGGILRESNAAPLCIGGWLDHVHLLFGFRPTHCLSDLIRDVKRGSSEWIHQTFRRSAFAWQSGYGAFTVGQAELPAVRRYIETQVEHHRVETFQEEYVRFLKDHLVEYDDRYLW